MLAMEEMFGGIITGNELFCLADGIAHFGAKGLFLETGGRPNKDEYCAPPPKCLEHHLPYQSLAVAMTIDMELQGLLMTFGPNMKCSNGVLSGSLSLYSNLKAQCTLNIADLEQQPSPQEIVNYVKEQLEGGIHTWDNGIRSYISLQYRGTILFACVLILIGQCSQAYKLLKWAIEFIDLADEEFHVTEEESYEDKGSAFKPTQRVGMLMALFEVQSVLRGNSLNGAYSISESIHIALAISEMAERTKLKEDSPGATAVEDYAFYVRKPLAKAHSSIAAILNLIHNQCDLMNFKQVAVHHDFIEDTDSFVDPRALVAQHYHIAAQNELFDDENCAIYWWGYASSMAMASPKSGYTLGQLREAIQKAMEAEKARDVSIFGINRQRGGTFENLAKLVATHFQSEPDSFILPKARLEGKAHKLSVYVGEKNICPHFHKFSMIDEEFNASLPKSTVTDISDLEEKCSADQPHEVPSLVTLSIRELHRSGCEFADGETDPNIIHYNAMVAAGSISDD